MKRIFNFGLLLVLGVTGGMLASIDVHADPFTADYAFRWHNDLPWVNGTEVTDSVCDQQATYLFKQNGYGSANCDSVYAFGSSNIRYNVTLYKTDGSEWGVSNNQQVKVKSCLNSPGSEGCVVGSSCPSSGTVKRIATAVNGRIDDNGMFIEDIPEGGNTITIGGSLSAQGCGFAHITSSDGVAGNAKPDVKIKCSKTHNACFRFENVVATGEALEPRENEAYSTIIDEPGVPDEETETSSDTRKSTTSTSQTDPVTNQVDGKTVTTQTFTETETRGDGSVVQTQDDVTTVTQSDGITRTDTKTTVTTTNADGSKTVETTNNISYTQNPQTIYNIDNSTGRVTVTATGGGTTSQQTRTTEGYNPQGQKVSESKEEGPVTGDDAAKEQQEEETCATNPLLDKCIGEFKETAKGEFGDIAGEVLDAKQEYLDAFDEVKEEVTEKLNFNLSGGGTTSDYMVSFRGTEGNIGITRWFTLFDQYDLAALVMTLAALISVFVLLRD